MNGRVSAIEYGTPIGRLREDFAYHAAGVLTGKRLGAHAGPWSLSAAFSYNNQGQLDTIQYPNGGDTLKYFYDSIGRQNRMGRLWWDGAAWQVTDRVWDVNYGPANEMLQWRRTIAGAGTATDNWTYNNRLQLTTGLGNTYNYPPAANAGQVESMTTAAGENVVYTYDSLQRLTNVATWRVQRTPGDRGLRMTASETCMRRQVRGRPRVGPGTIRRLSIRRRINLAARTTRTVISVAARALRTTSRIALAR